MAQDYLEYNNNEPNYSLERNPLEKNIAQIIREKGQLAPNNTVEDEADISEVKQMINMAITASAADYAPALATITGYDATKTQTLTNDNGTFKWVTNT